MEKIHTFKSFSQLREEATKVKQMKEVADRQSKSIESYSKLLKEYGVASPSELDEEVRNAFFARLAESVDVSLTINESTRAQIGVADKKGNISTVYLHYGSMGDNADVIRQFGGKEAKELVKLGKAGISFLGKKLGPKNNFANPDYEMTMFYGRDRGEKGNSVNSGKMDAIQDFARKVRNSAGAEYIYIWDEATSKWFYMDAYEDQELKVFEGVNESTEDLNEGRSINKIQKDWSEVTSKMAATASEWKAAEGDAKTKLLADLKEMTAKKKALEAELDAAVAGKDKDLELAVESVVIAEGAVKQFEMDYKDMETNIKRGIGWIDPEYAAETWYNSSSSFQWDLVASEVYERLIKAGLLWFADETGEGKGKQVKSLRELGIKESVNEAFEVHYSDGVRAMKKFNDKNKAMSFAKDLIKTNKSLQFVDIFNAGSGFHSTADTDAIVAFWGDGSYTDNVAKKDSKLAAKKMNEAVLNEANDVKSEAISRLADFFRVPASSLQKFKFDGSDNVKELTKALNSTSDQGSKLYYDMAIKLAKEELGVDESVEINEEDIKTEEQFREYAIEVLKKAHGEDYDEAKAKETIDGIVAKVDGDFGAAIGMLTSNLG
jgi:hypothetical protein